MSGTRLTHNMILKHGWSLVNIMAIIGQHYFKVEFLNLGSMGTVGWISFLFGEGWGLLSCALWDI